ncbi:hypothetical protein CERZMDRAFT_46054 [Cercospora zeae-maydis SCOH1-5]|uniref:Metallo-beta-lactamase domain-containing protein n=1 Tax=Cercospora zeae-maydis SCOH1-5 TaxID=717836 RepID=A0A6A6FA02_9PEZI|nr:hypothetical protein CERZMDRAFT_46054 [Cercospora zeae-maydis SCOH1-5]
MSVGPVKFDLDFWGDFLDAQRQSLPTLPSVQRLSDRVIRILGCNPGRIALQGTNTYLIGTGTSRILVDTGQGRKEWIDLIANTLQSQSIQISHVLLTHWHGDHTGGLSDLIAFDNRLRHVIYKWKPDGGQCEMRNRQIFRTEGATLEALHLPGHAEDHTCFLLKEENALFTGDNVLGHGFSTSDNLVQYVASLRTMLTLRCDVGYPGHGERIADLSAKIKEYLHVQHAREVQICKALAGESGGDRNLSRRKHVTTEELAEMMFPAIHREVRKLSVTPVLLENLWLLAAERRVGFVVEKRVRRWYLRSTEET